MKSALIRSLILAFTLSLPAMALAAGENSPAPDDAERKAVLEVVQKFFAAMETRDNNAMRELLLPDSRSFSTREEDGKPVVRARLLAEFASRLPIMKDKVLERIWNPTVLVHDRIATVWAPYDLHLNDQFSHGGIDIFNLVKITEGWRIASLLYTVEPNTKVRHPNGPPPGVK